MNIPKHIFRPYDIRGIVPEELNFASSTAIGKALGTILIRDGKKKCVVGMDNRRSSPEIAGAFIAGLISTGCDVTDIGFSLTPIIHFLTSVMDFDCGVIVTSSHNPKEYNGFRIDYKDSISFYGEDIQKLYQLVTDENFAAGSGKLKKKDLFDAYVNYLKDQFLFPNKIKVVIDCGNGTTSFMAPRIFEELGCEVLPFYCDSNSDYPHGIPDPENRLFLSELQKKVVLHDADVGFAFDTDADRFGVVDELGQAHDVDKLLMLMAQYILKTNPKAKIVFDVKCSNLVCDFIENNGGMPEVLRTGHPYFVQAMKKGALLGGEFSGHMYFNDKYFGYDDGIYAACRVLKILSETGEKLSKLMSIFPKLYHSSEIKILCDDRNKRSVVESVAGDKKLVSLSGVVFVDGVRVKLTKTGWFLIRESNTSPYLSVRVEGESHDEIRLLLQAVSDLLSKFSFLDLTPLKTAKIYFS